MVETVRLICQITAMSAVSISSVGSVIYAYKTNGYIPLWAILNGLFWILWEAWILFVLL